MIDKNYCISSYLVFRPIDKDDADFFPGLHHQNIVPVKDSEKTLVKTAADIDKALFEQFERLERKNVAYFQAVWIPLLWPLI